MKLRNGLTYILHSLAVPIVFCFVWYLITRTGLINRLFIPSPTEVGSSLLRLFSSGEIWDNLGATFFRMMAGFLLASIIGIPLGIVLGHFRKAYVFSEFFIDFTRSIPATALFPLFMLILGVGDKSKIAIVCFSCLFVILINSIYGVWNSPKDRVLMARTFRATNTQIFSKIILFDALPQIFAGLRNALSIALILAVVTEMFVGTNRGLGFIIYNSKIAYDTPTMYAVIILTGILGYSTNRCLLLAEKRTIHWSR